MTIHNIEKHLVIAFVRLSHVTLTVYAKWAMLWIVFPWLSCRDLELG